MTSLSRLRVRRTTPCVRLEYLQQQTNNAVRSSWRLCSESAQNHSNCVCLVGKPETSRTTSIREEMHADLMLVEAGRVRERPAEDGSVSANADDVTLVWTDPQPRDRSAVSKSNVRHCSFLVQPDLLETSSFFCYYFLYSLFFKVFLVMCRG